MLDRFGEVYGAQERQAAAAAGLSDHEVVILASIVEREAQLEEERAVIASVYLNRLEQGMLLQADPTVQFAVSDGAESGWWKDPLTLSDLQSESPYNTYRHAGLPPGPDRQPRGRLDSGGAGAGRDRFPVLRGPRRRFARVLRNLRGTPAERR